MLSLVNHASITVFNVAAHPDGVYVVDEYEQVYLGGEAIG
jgi:hypothetical protein